MHRSASKMRRPLAFMSTQNVILHDEVVMSMEDEGLVNLRKNVLWKDARDHPKCALHLLLTCPRFVNMLDVLLSNAPRPWMATLDTHCLKMIRQEKRHGSSQTKESKQHRK